VVISARRDIVVCLALVLGVHACKESSRPAVRAIAAGDGHACALLEGGTVRCWGYNSQGQLGVGDTQDRLRPTAVVGLEGVVQLALADSSSCALLANGTARCWGWNLQGQLGGDDRKESRPVPAPVPELSGAVEIALGTSHGCARLGDGSVRCWGENAAGEVGDSSGTKRAAATPVLDPDTGGTLTGVTALALGGSHSCALMRDETARCWGLNNLGQLGTGTHEDWRYVPTPVVGLRGVKRIAARSYLSCALLGDGTVHCWGGGAGARHATGVPLPVEGLTRAASLVIGGRSKACARLDDGALSCWGSASGDTPPLGAVEEAALGWGFRCARGAPGWVKCWGENEHGSLGDGTREQRSQPAEVSW
jgi:alpha-tubulin suppressor-like RCC1 family protein